MNSPTGKSGFATTPLDSPIARCHRALTSSGTHGGAMAPPLQVRQRRRQLAGRPIGGLQLARRLTSTARRSDRLDPTVSPDPGQASRCALMANTGSLGFARPRVLPSCWRRYLPPTARAWLPVSGWGARAARTSADIVAPCGVGQTRRRRWPWRRTFGASRDRSSARGSVGELCRLYLEAVGWVGQASRCATRISAAARAMAAYAPRTAIAASGVSSPAERCTVMAACTAVPGRY